MEVVAMTQPTSVFAQYRKSLVGTQIVIGIVTVAALIETRRIVAALAFFAVMQVGAIAGAAWAASLKNRIANARRTLRA
jgi:hypothetical protein